MTNSLRHSKARSHKHTHTHSPHSLSLLTHALTQIQFIHSLPQIQYIHSLPPFLLPPQIASAACHLHAHSIVHRDLKALNVVLCGGGDGARNAQVGSKPTLHNFPRTPSFLSPHTCASLNSVSFLVYHPLFLHIASSSGLIPPPPPPPTHRHSSSPTRGVHG